MEILVYQLLIVASLIVLRIFGGTALLIGAIVWSCLTVANLFFPPLIVIQLVVVWITYALLAPKSQSKPVDTPAQSQAPIPGRPPSPRSTASPIPPARIGPPKSASTPPVIVKVGAPAAPQTPRLVHPAIAKRKAVLDLEMAFVNLLLGRAKTEVETMRFLATADLQTRQIYTDERARRALQDGGAKPREHRYDDFGFADNGPPSDADPAVQIRLHQSWREIERAHHDALQDVIVQLRADEDLKSKFKKVARVSGASGLITRLDEKGGGLWLKDMPASSLPTSKEPNSLSKEPVLPQPANTSLGRNATNEPLARGIEGSVLFPPDAIAIRQIAEERNVPHLVHFTSIKNLESILTNGLQSVSDVLANDLDFEPNDDLRLDGRHHATSTSISFPNAAMFWKYRQSAPASEWAVLLLDRAILWKQECYFCRHNAADSRIIKMTPQSLMKPDAFADMFAELEGVVPRETQNLKPYDPTDPQAEVMVLGVIPPEAITTIVFNNGGLAAAYSHLANGRSIEVHERNGGYYGQRSFSRVTRERN